MMKKIIASILTFAMIAAVSTSVFASETVDYGEQGNSVGEIDMANPKMARGIFDDYVDYCHKEFIRNSQNVAIGGQGWTDIDEKKDGSDRYHYSNVQVSTGNRPESSVFESGRSWGYGRVSVSTGNVGISVSNINIYYGW